MNNTIQQTANADLLNRSSSTTAHQKGDVSRGETPAAATRKPKKARTASGKRSNKKPEAGSLTPASGQSAGSKSFRPGTKAEIILRKLKITKGATIDELVEATGWQSHSVRGFLSGTVKKKLGLELVSEAAKDGIRRYRITDGKSES
ncbi:MAG: DUF3489 domain-containing protein [Rhizobiaceae bacterium]